MNKEFKQYAMADLQRSIPSMVDGLKPQERKILFYALKKPIIQKIKVTEFSIYVLNHSPYHDGEKPIIQKIKVTEFSTYVLNHSPYHDGEVTLVDTIIGMAQNYVGSNNINLLEPKGEFGTRWMYHADVTLPFPWLSPITRYLFHKDDELLLHNYLNKDGQSIEPAWFIPIIPMVLVNGSEARGAWSSFIPNYNPRDIIANLIRLLEVLEVFYRFRLHLYEKRKTSLPHELKIALLQNKSKERFARAVRNKELDLEKPKSGKCVELKEKCFKTLPSIKREAREETPPKEEDEDVAVKGYDGYDYLISQLDDIFEPEYIEELEEERKATDTKLQHLTAATPKSLWLADLAALDAQLALVRKTFSLLIL
ncbi:DNA topoisomerase 2 [Tanacetum coccineum]